MPTEHFIPATKRPDVALRCILLVSLFAIALGSACGGDGASPTEPTLAAAASPAVDNTTPTPKTETETDTETDTDTDRVASAAVAPPTDGAGPSPLAATTPAFDGAEGFGALSEGGRGGTVYTVTNLNDSGDGSFRWAVERTGRRIVQFAVHGVIKLQSPINIREPYITIDGRGALDPGETGITIRDHAINIRTNHVIVRYIRVRLGDYAVARRVITSGRTRPSGSDDLDCINIDHAENVILDHVSMSWSADEIVSVTNSRNVTIQWSILSEPLGGKRDGIYIHPYGDNHNYPANNSAATLTYHHNLFAHYRFRGPQFEPNDAASWRSPNNPSFEAVNNVIYGYTDSGSRFRHGFELPSDRNRAAQYYFHFVGNRYLDSTGAETEINAAIDAGIEDNIFAYVRDNIGPHRRPGDPQTALVFTSNNAANPVQRNAKALRQFSATPLFASTVPVTVQAADTAKDLVLGSAGCNIRRDGVDDRVVADARANRPAKLRITQEGLAGGWPSYHPTLADQPE